MDLGAYEAYLFDLDGVITPTADVHMRAWSEMFNAFLLAHHPEQRPYEDADYFAHVDGKPRYDGVSDFLASRGIVLPLGEVTDSPETLTIRGIGNRKNVAFNEIIERDGVVPYAGSAQLIVKLAQMGRRLAVVSSSRNAPAVLKAAGLAHFFPVVMDGNRRAELGIPGKPAPDMFNHAAAELGVPTQRCVVLEDAISGVEAGAAGDFALVVGVDRGVGSPALVAAGADMVVTDLDELLEA